MKKLYSNRSVRGGRNTPFIQPTKYSTRSGKTILAPEPMCDDPRLIIDSDTEQSCQQALRKAATYASLASEQDTYLCEAKWTGTTAYAIALADWFGCPKVLEINVDNWTGETGQMIRVKARGNVKVARVAVVIRDTQKNVLEAGEAVQSESGGAWWHYTTQSQITMMPFPTVEAIAQDLPGNMDSFIIS